MGNKNAKGRPLKVTLEYLKIFSDKLSKNPKATLQEVYNLTKPEHQAKLKVEIRRQYPAWDAQTIEDKVREMSPTPDTVRKALKKADKYTTLMTKFDTDPDNKPWNMGALVSHDLPASALSLLLEIREERRKKSEEPLTIREAWWAARLGEIIKTTRVYSRTRVIDYWAKLYAKEHRFSVMLDRPLETTKLDTILRNHAEAYASYTPFWDAVESKEGFEATAKLFNSLLDQEEIVHSFEKTELLEELTRFRKQTKKAEEPMQESKRIWQIVFNISDKFALDSLQETKAKMASNPRIKTWLQEQHGKDYEQQLDKRIAELNEKLSKREKEAQNERTNLQTKG